MFNPWLALTFKTVQLGLDIQNVIALRMMRLAVGAARGQREARRMVVEKVAAAAEAQTAAASAVNGRSQRYSCCQQSTSSLEKTGSCEEASPVS